jgi:hypothetical protein
LPPDLFSRIVQSAFWDDKEQLPAGLRVVWGIEQIPFLLWSLLIWITRQKTWRLHER